MPGMRTWRRRACVTVLSVVVGLGVVVAGGSATAAPATSAKPRGLLVSLGDSYISGEAGRWQGNSSDPVGDRTGTDRAFTGSAYDPAIVYGSTAANGCHRSDVAEVTHARWLKPVNIACSGATTTNVLRASVGGESFKGEAPQNDQLALIARAQRVSAVVLSIGGNDLGFADIVTNCVAAYLTAGAPCSTTQQSVVDERMPAMRAAVARTIADIRDTLADAGYRASSYRLILQSYPIPLATAADLRYPEQGPDRLSTGGCPFLDADADWDLAGQIADNLRTVATTEHVQFLDLRDAFHGHELCSSAASQPTTPPPSEATSEWIRWIDLAGQGELNESLHPNAFGQHALGNCLALTLLLTRRNVACHDVPGRDARSMSLRPLR